MKKIFIWILAFVVMSSMVFASDWTYQETADEIACEGDWYINYPCSNTYDGFWTTFGWSTSAGQVYFNYTKPLGASSSSLWSVKDYLGEVNLSIPSSCWSYDSNKLVFQAESNLDGYTNWLCYDGNWNYVRNSGDKAIYEEAMWWNIEEQIPSECDYYVGDTVNLPQATAVHQLDTNPSGGDLTYLYCTWEIKRKWTIGGTGEQIQQMNSQLCPNPQQSVIFNDDGTYDYVAVIGYGVYNYDNGWQLVDSGLESESQVTEQYKVCYPGVEPSLLQQLMQSLVNIICNWFPWLGFCP